MSIASEITRLQGVKADILTAIGDKGVTVPAGSALDDCPGLIANISGGGGAVVIGGRTYRTVKIGTQEWLAENLDYKFSGCTIGANGTSTSEPRGNYYNDDESTYGYGGSRGESGLLYNWAAAKYLDDNKATLLPDGWRVPTNSDWTTLSDFVGGLGFNLKKGPGTVWGYTWNGGEVTKFDAYPTGVRSYQESYSNLGEFTIWWASNIYSEGNGARCGVDRTNLILISYDPMASQFPIRLVRDT